MKICVPTKDDRGLASTLYGHFGSAPFFTIVNIESGQLEVVANVECQDHSGSCHHIDRVKSYDVDAVVCSGVGRRAFAAMQAAGIDVLTSAEGVVSDIVKAIRAGDGHRLSANEACGGGRRRIDLGHQL
jgi:ArsR family transcriptional regulator